MEVTTVPEHSELNELEFDFSFEPNQKLVYHLAKWEMIDFIYNTTALEGNPFTYVEVQTLLEGVTVGGHRLSDEQQILNQNRAVNFLFESLKRGEFNLSLEFVNRVNSLVAFEEALEWGRFRSGEVSIGGSDFKPPKSSELEDIFGIGVRELKKVTHPIKRAIGYFLFGALNQFHFDGNKRTSRLIMNGLLISNGYPILNIKVRDKLEFNKQMIAFYDSQNYTRAISYLLEYYKEQNG